MPPASATWLDGSPTSTLPLPDRGLDFGDGLFETLLLQGGRPLYPELHLQRLERGQRVLALPDCLEAARRQLASAAGIIGKWGWDWTALRLTVLRVAGERGYAPGETDAPRILINATRLERDCGRMAAAATLSLADTRLAEQPALAGIKHLNRLEQVLAAIEAKGAGGDESLMLDREGRLVCVVAGNLFLVRRGKLYTPRLTGCGVLGTRRRLVIERWAPRLGLTVREAGMRLADLQEAEEVFYSNSLYTVRPIARVNQLSWAEHPVCEALFSAFREDWR
jgi:4-amino-4-deoxychorismate lyase